jgi:hypothetical protein
LGHWHALVRSPLQLARATTIESAATAVPTVDTIIPPLTGSREETIARAAIKIEEPLEFGYG